MSNEEQAEYWSEQVNWVTFQDQMDTTLAPVLDLVLDKAALQPGEAVLDIGCGTGASTLRAAQVVGPEGSALGLDISPTLLASARARLGETGNAETLEADAQAHPFEPVFDAMISRFGVMFFADTPAAFRNIATALRPGGRMVFTAWGPAPKNPWFMVPAKAAQEHLGQPPKVDRTLPGPFAFEERDRVLGYLRSAGLHDVSAEEVDVTLTPPGDLDANARLQTHIGPVNSIMRHFEGTDADRAIIHARLIDVLAQFETPSGLRIPACLNIYSVRVA